jgi:hypothetical protein
MKNELTTILNKNSLGAHTKLELDVLGVTLKLVNYVLHFSRRNNWKNYIFCLTGCPNNKQPFFGLKEI